jgi:hypothetical protein
MEEKRKLHRHNLIYYLKVFDRANGALLGRLVDITPEGILLISEQPIDTDATFDLSLEFPHPIFGSDKLDFSAQSLWSNCDTNPDLYDTGFRLLDVPIEHVLLITKLVSEYGFRD